MNGLSPSHVTIALPSGLLGRLVICPKPAVFQGLEIPVIGLALRLPTTHQLQYRQVWPHKSIKVRFD